MLKIKVGTTISSMKKTACILFFLLCFSALTAGDILAQVLVEDKPSVLQEDKPQTNYVYDLKMLIQKSRANIKNVNEKIKEQAVQKRNQQREEKAREYFLQAQKMVDEGRLEESRQLFDRAIRITEHPEMKYYIKESQHRAKVQEAALTKQEGEQQQRLEGEEKAVFERVESMYQGAVSLYKQQRFVDARQEFQAVDEVFPEYKAVRSYLQIIEQDIAQSEHRSVKDQKNEIENQHKEAEIARLREKELWRKEIDRKEQSRKKELDRQAQSVYDDAIQLYQDRKYLAARDKFQEVELVMPDFKATHSYLQRIERDIEMDKVRITGERQKTVEKQRWEDILAQKKAEEERKKALSLREREQLEQKKEQAEFVYQLAIVLFNSNSLEQAKEKFNEVEGIYPDYKSTRDYLRRMGIVLEDIKESVAPAVKSGQRQKDPDTASSSTSEDKVKLKNLAVETNALYVEAFDLYKAGKLVEAKAGFLEVDQRIPDYKNTRSYLKRIDDDISSMVTGRDTGDALAVQRDNLERLKELRDKAEVPYNQAIIAYNNNDLQTAKIKFNETDSLFPNYKKVASYLGHIDQDIQRNEEQSVRKNLEKKAEEAYTKALALYNSEQYEEAKEGFLAVVMISPNFKQTSAYLERLDDDIIRQKEEVLDQVRDRQTEILYSQAMVLYRSSEFEGAKEKLLELEAIAPDYKDSVRYLKNIDEDILHKKTEADHQVKVGKAEETYSQAVALYKVGDFESAKEKFVSVEFVYPGYKDVAKYLASIDGDIQRKKHDAEIERQADEVEPVYVQGLELYKAREFLEAKKKFLQVQLAYPNYKETQQYLVRVEQDVRSQEERLLSQEKKRKVDALYTEAIKLYADRKFELAKNKFIETAAIDSNYHNTRSYLSQIDKDIHTELLRLSRSLQQEQAEKLYVEALSLHQAGSFEAAKGKFTAVIKIQADYKKSRAYLLQIDQDIRNQKKEQLRLRTSQAELDYTGALSLLEKKEILNAYRKFMVVETQYPDYKSVRKYLSQTKNLLIKKGIAIPAGTEKVPAAVLVVAPSVPAIVPLVFDDDSVLELYKTAVTLYKNKDLTKAKTQFEYIQQVRPNYRSTTKYIDAINVAMPKTNSQSAGDVPLGGNKADLLQAPVKIEDFSRKSDVLYRQICALVEDKDFTGSNRTFTQIDKIVQNLEGDKNRIAQEIQRQEQEGRKVARHAKDIDVKNENAEADARSRQAALKQKQDEQQGEEARIRLLDNARELKDVKHRDRERLEQVKDQEKEVRLKAEVFYQQGLAALKNKKYSAAREHFADAQKVIPRYKDIDRLRLNIDRIDAEKDLIDQEKKDRLEIADLAGKASLVNLAAQQSAGKKDFVALQQQFEALSSLLGEIRVIKGRMMSRRDTLKSEWENKMMAFQSKPDVKPSIRDMKAMVEGRTAHQQAEVLYNEGRELYDAGEYLDARVKFRDAFSVDPSFKAAYTFAQRIDRIIERHDFEDQKTRIRIENRAFEQKSESKSVAASRLPVVADPKRAAIIFDEGIELYKNRRFREARIKFEELLKVGDSKQVVKAQRYLALTESGIEKEQKAAEQEKIRQEEMYLEAKRVEIRLAWERDKVLQLRQQADPSVPGEQAKVLSAERELLLEKVEHSDSIVRRKMLAQKNRQSGIAEKDVSVERNKIQKTAARQKMKMEGSTRFVEPGQPDAVKTRGTSTTVSAVVATDLRAEKASREKISSGKSSSKGLSATLSVIDSREERQFQRIIAQQNAAQVKTSRIRSQRIEQQRRARELQQAMREKKKRLEEDKLIQRSQKDISMMVTAAAQVKKVKGEKKVIPEAAKAGAVPGNKKLVLPDVSAPGQKLAIQAAADEEKRKLDEQRIVIARDFEFGVERLYVQAVDLYKKRMYAEARNDFKQVNDFIKGYKKTGEYLILVDREIAKNSLNFTLPVFSGNTAAPVKADSRLQSISRTLDAFELTPSRK